jgi:hypothetical protein
MNGFKKYVEKNHIRDLFSGSDFNIQKSHNDLGVQLADFIAGTLGYIFDDLKKSEKSTEFEKLISTKLISLNHFPKNYEIKELMDSELYSEYDETITNLSLNRVFDFIDRTTGNTQLNVDRINFLNFFCCSINQTTTKNTLHQTSS